MEYWKKKIRSPLCIAQAVIWLAALVFFICNFSLLFSLQNTTADFQRLNFSNYLLSDSPVTVHFRLPNGTPQYIEVPLVHADSGKNAPLHFAIQDQNGETVFTKDYADGELAGVDALRMEVPKGTLQHNAPYTMTITGDSRLERDAWRLSIGFSYGSDISSWEHNNIVQPDELNIGFLYTLPNTKILILLILFMLLGLAAILCPPLTKRWMQISYNVLFALCAPVMTVFVTEILQIGSLGHMLPMAMLWNFVLILAVGLIAFAFIGNVTVSVLVSNALLQIFGIVNHFVLDFRGTVLSAADLAGVNAAMDVANSYTFNISLSVVVAACYLSMLFCLGVRDGIRLKGKKNRLIVGVTCLLLSSLAFYNFSGKKNNKSLGILSTYFLQNDTSRQNGFLLNFFTSIAYTRVDKPVGYSATAVSNLAEEYRTSSVPKRTQEQKPNVVVIMMESWSDFSRLGNPGTEFDTMKNLHALRSDDNPRTYAGNLVVPVYGSGTSCSEFESITGFSMSQYDTLTAPFSMYVKDGTPSLGRRLGAEGYSVLGIHPGSPVAWNRRNAYAQMGYPTFLFQNDDAFRDADRIRTFISDECFFNVVEDKFTAMLAEDAPVFISGISIQDHGGYDTGFATIDMQAPYSEFLLAREYQSLMDNTDYELGRLLDFFEQVDEPTIVVIFGDHLPGVEHSYYEKVSGRGFDDMFADGDATLYQTPVVLWANYDVDFSYLPDTFSANYLYSVVMQSTGITPTPYENMLAYGLDKMPVYAMSAPNIMAAAEQDDTLRQFVQDYRIMQYNLLHDPKHRDDSLLAAA